MIYMNKKYRTRDGNAARILVTDLVTDTPYKVLAAVTGDDGQEICFSYTIDGKFYYSTSSGSDLVEFTPWDDFKVDDPVLVKNLDDNYWVKRYFAGVDANGDPTTWYSGATSWSTSTQSIVEHWDECKSARDVDNA